MLRFLRLVLLSLLLLASACSTVGQAQPTPQPSPSPTTAASPPLVLTLWHSWSGRSAQVLDLLARRYEQSHPEVRISLQTRPAASLVRDYEAGVADGSAPQLLLVRSRYLGELAEQHYVLPLKDKPIQDRLPELLPAAVDAARVGGVLQGVPLSFDSLVLFYDQRQMSQPPKTMEDAISFMPPQATPITERSWGLAYYLSAPTTLPYLKVFGGSIFAANGTIMLDNAHRTAAIQWLEWLQSLHRDVRTTATDDFGVVDALVQSNHVASVIDWSHRLADYERLWGADAVGVAPLPSVTGRTVAPAPSLLADVVCINAVVGQQRAAAVDFLAYLASQPAQELLWTRGGELPVNQRVRLDGPPKAMVAAVPGAVAFPNTPVAAQAWPLLDEMIRSVLAGSATPTEAFDKAAAGLRALTPRP